MTIAVEADASHKPASTIEPFLWSLAILFLAVFGTAWGGIWLTREAGRVASIWAANAIVLSFVLSSVQARWSGILITGYIANVSANIFAGDQAVLAASLSLCNTLEVLIAGVLIRHLLENVDLTRTRDLAIFFASAVVAAPLVTATAAAFTISLLAGGSALAVWPVWFAADSLGMLIVTPVLLSIGAVNFGSSLLAFLRPASITVFAALIAITLFVFLQSDYPFLFLVLGILVLAAFKLDALGIAISVTVVAAITIGATVEGFGPMQLIKGSTGQRILFLQTFLVASVLLALTVSSILAERRRLELELKLARSVAERANQTKSDFLATVSHEIRTPLHGITGFTQILLNRSDLPKPIARQIGMIEQASFSLQTLVDELLDFSKVEAGRVVLIDRPFSVLIFVDNCVSIARGAANLKSIEIKIEISPDVPRYIDGDESRLKQVLLNLLYNAVKFTPDGIIKLIVDVDSTDKKQPLLRFAVKDTGIGIPRDKQAMLFEKFMQVDSSASREFGGAGLGLAICKSLVQLMDGNIGLESEPGRGSTFFFTIPLRRAVGPLPNPSDNIAYISNTSSAHLLLVEDLPMNQEVAVAMLKTAGHRVDVAEDGFKAIQAVKERRYDAILMDIQMPGMDGIAASKAIRALPGSSKSIPIVALTANVVPSEIARFREAGIDAHVGKPFRRDILLRTIDQILEGRVRNSDGAEMSDSNDDQNAPDLNELIDMLGRDRVLTLVARFKTDLDNALKNDPPDREQLAAESHKIVSQAGMLGFHLLSEAARALEQAALLDQPYDDALAKALREKSRAGRQIALMLPVFGMEKRQAT